MEEIRYLSGEEKKRSRSLWEQAFPEDSKAFDDYYFEEKLKDNRILVKEEDGQIVSMVQLNPYQVRVGKREYSIDYIVGVATDKDRRHRGHMRDLLAHMMREMRKERVPFTFLMPASEAIYRPFDFRFTCPQPVFVQKQDKNLKRLEIQENDGEAVKMAADWMEKWLEKRFQVFTVRDEAYVARLLKELASENGYLSALLDGEKMAGLEAFWGLVQKEQRLLYCEEEYAETAEEKPVMMVRIIHLEEFLSMFSLKETCGQEELVVEFSMKDSWLPENDGYYRWTIRKSGSTAKKFLPEMILTEKLTEPGELVSQLLGAEEMAGIRENLSVQKIFFDEIV